MKQKRICKLLQLIDVGLSAAQSLRLTKDGERNRYEQIQTAEKAIQELRRDNHCSPHDGESK